MEEIEINLTLKVKVPQEGLNVNGVLQGLGKGIREMWPQMLRCILHAVEEREIARLQRRGSYVRNGHTSRQRIIRTEFGAVPYRLQQMQEKTTGRTVVPLRESAFLLPYGVGEGEETLEKAVGAAIHLSYRRAASETERMGGGRVSPMGVHRRLQKLARQRCQLGNLQHIPYRFLMVDGTGYRRQGARGRDLGRGEFRCALAATGVGSPFDTVGVWVDTSWADIRSDLEQRLRYDHLEVLLADGESGAERLLAEGMRFQRCVIHGKRDFAALLYADGITGKAQKPFRERLAALPVFSLHKKRLEQVTEEDRPLVEKAAEHTKEGFRALLALLDEKRYPQSRTYIKNLVDNVTTFLDWWLHKGEWIDATTNIIEGTFSRIKNRIKNVGRRWSDRGMLNWLLVAVQKIFYPGLWRTLWEHFDERNPAIEMKIVHIDWKWLSCPIT